MQTLLYKYINRQDNVVFRVEFGINPLCIGSHQGVRSRPGNGLSVQLEQQMRGETMNPSDDESSKNTKGKLASKITRMGGIFGRRH